MTRQISHTLFTPEEITAGISKLKLGKAPGEDGITAQLIKNSGELLPSCLTTLLNACLLTGFFPTQLKTANTIILKKPGKPDCHNPSAYRPIALLSCLSKLLEGALADGLQMFAELHSLLPECHYGGRAKRSTTDALLNLTLWTKNQWAKVNVVGALLVDVKAAFSTVNPDRMIHTMKQMGYCTATTNLISNFLHRRLTTFQLGDYQSEPKQLTIGLPQGSPLLVILYILYNSSLLRQAEGVEGTAAMGFFNDVAFLTARKTHDEVQLSRQHLANKELAWGRQHGAAFDRQKSQWMLLTHRKNPSPDLSINLEDVTLTPQPLVKWLGVLIYTKLTFLTHIKTQAAKGLKTAHRHSSLAKTGWGIPLSLCLRLTSSLIHSRTDYACAVWHKFQGPPNRVAAIQ